MKWNVLVGWLAVGLALSGCSKASSEAERPAEMQTQNVEARQNDEATVSHEADSVPHKSKELEQQKRLAEAQSIYETAMIKLEMPGPMSAEAIELLWKAANMEYVPAMRQLGLFLIDAGEEDDPNTAVNQKAGRQFLEKAANAGDVDAAGGLVAHYFSRFDNAQNEADRLEYHQQMLNWGEKANGNMLACRVFLEALHETNAALREQAERDFAPCVAAFEVNRWNCNLIRGYVDRDEAFEQLGAEVRRSVGNALVQCYERAVAAGDPLGADVPEPGQTSQQNIELLKANARYAW